MPKLLFFAACEKVILSTDQTVSLITIMESVTIGLSKDVPQNAPLMVPIIWYATSLWHREPKDKDGRHYEQKVELLFEDRSVAVTTEPIAIEFGVGKFNNRGVFGITGFPVPLKDSLASLELSIRSIGKSEWAIASSFPIFVKRKIEALNEVNT